MPSTLEGLFALFGFLVIFVSFMSGTLKWRGASFQALKASHRLAARLVGVLLILVSIMINYSSSSTIETKPILNKVYISNFLSEKNINQIKKFPVVGEILSAKARGDVQYQVVVCNDKINGKIAVPSDFTRCPFDNALPRNGPIVDLSQF